MRLRSYLVGLAVITSSFIAVNPAEAQSRNGWIKATCKDNGECFYVKKLGGTWPYIKFKANGPADGVFDKEADCKRWRLRFLNSREWYDVMPDSIGETIISIVCR